MNTRSFVATAMVGWCLALAVGAFAQDAPAVPTPPAAGGTATADQSPAVPTPPVAGGTATADQSYVLGPEDVIEIEAVGRQDFKSRVKIATDGTIQLPYLGSVVAANKTTQELSDDISKALESGGFFSHPILRLEIVGYASRYVTVLGEVTSPGLIPIDRPYHLSEILARVGGLKERAADYVIVRPEKGAPVRFSVKTLATGDTSQDPLVSPGDKIFSPDAEMFYISGQVRNPGTYSYSSDMTLRMAVARGGGLTDLGTDRAVQVTRDGKKLGRLDLDSRIEAGDVIVVGERLF